MLPILHLNENKIAGPTVLGRKDEAEVRKLLEGHGYEVISLQVDADTPHEQAHREFSQALATAHEKIVGIQQAARRDDWDGTWAQESSHPRFREQVEWELDGLERRRVASARHTGPKGT